MRKYPQFLSIKNNYANIRTNVNIKIRGIHRVLIQYDYIRNSFYHFALILHDGGEFALDK